MIYTSLISNAALLITLGVLYDMLSRNWQANRRVVQVVMGMVFGCLGIAVMTNSWEYAPGIIFDTRSILLATGGVFLGGVPTVIAMVITSLFRLQIGGPAAWLGVAVIWTSGSLGVSWRYLRRDNALPWRFRELYGFGVLVHVAMLLWMLTLPWPLSLQLLSTITLPVMLIYPFGTVLLGKLMAGQQARRDLFESLARSEANYRELVQSARSVVLRLDAQGRITFINEFAQSFFEFSEAEIIGCPVVGTIVPETESTGRDLTAMVDAVYRNPDQFSTMENENTRKDGERVWVAWTNRGLFDEAGQLTGILCVGADITDRKRTDAELQRTQQLLDQTQTLAKIGGWEYDVATRHMRWTEEVYRIYGLDSSSYDPNNVDQNVEFYGPDDRARIKHAFQRALQEGQPYDLELAFIDAQGQNLWVRTMGEAEFQRGKVTRVFGNIIDVTDRKQAEIAIRENEERLRLKLDTILSPDTEVSDQELVNVLDMHAFGALLEDFTAVTGQVTAVLDLKGNVLVATGWQDICARFHRAHPKSAEYCRKSDLYLTENVKPGEYLAYKCENQLWDVVTPLIIGNKHIGNVYTGQFFYDDDAIDRGAFAAQAAKYGFDQESYLSALDRVPRLSREKVDKTIRFLIGLTSFVSKLAYSNIKLASAMCEQQRIAEQLQESETRFRTLFEQTPIGVALAEPGTGRFLEVNKEFCNIIEYSREEMLNTNFINITHPEDIAASLSNMAKLVAHEIDSLRVEKRFVRKSGEAVWVHLTVIPLRSPGDTQGTHIAMMRDITEQKRIEEELRRNEVIVSISQDMMALLDTNCVYLFANDAYLHAFGKTKDEVVGHSVPELFGQSVFESVMYHHIRECLQGKEVHYHSWFEFPVHGRRCLDVAYFPYSDASQEVVGVVVCARDITAGQEAELALRRSEERFELAMLGANDGLWDYDVTSGTIYYSPRWKSMLGYAENELDDQLDVWIRLLDPDDRDEAVSHLQDFLSGDKDTYEIEFRMRCKGGNQIFVLARGFGVRDDMGKISRVVGTQVDITARKIAERTLQRSNQRLAMLRDIDAAIVRAQSTDAIARNTLAQLRKMITCSRGNVFLYDRSTEEIALFAVDASPEVQPQIGRRFHIDESTIYEHMRSRRPILLAELTPMQAGDRSAMEGDNVDRIRSLISTPLRVKGELVGVLSLWSYDDDAFTPEHKEIVDEVADLLAISLHQTQLHERIQQHASVLERRVIERTDELQEKNAELESFAHSVSHDLRAPLRAMDGFAHALLEDYSDRLDQEGREFLHHIVDSAIRMDILIADLLTYSRISRTELRIEAVQLDSIVRQALNNLQSEIQANKARVSVAEPLPLVQGHSSTLLQVISNLVSNALKFVAKDVRPEIHIWAENRPGVVRLCVQDNGIGIPEQHQDRIFEVFERLHGIETYPGTGIGLAIVRRATLRLGGQCGLESLPGKGSCFWVEYADYPQQETSK